MDEGVDDWSLGVLLGAEEGCFAESDECSAELRLEGDEQGEGDEAKELVVEGGDAWKDAYVVDDAYAERCDEDDDEDALEGARGSCSSDEPVGNEDDDGDDGHLDGDLEEVVAEESVQASLD